VSGELRRLPMPRSTRHELRDGACQYLAQGQIVGGGVRTQCANDIAGNFERNRQRRLGHRDWLFEVNRLLEISICLAQ
jgi:hypothetical protein